MEGHYQGNHSNKSSSIGVSATNFVCVQCGASSENLYWRYSNELIEVSKCERCRRIVDHYIEHDNVIILIDSILLRIQAFRHLLFNSGLRTGWALRVFILTSLCEAYHHWAVEHKDQQAITAAIETSFYLKLLSALAGLALQMFLSLVLLSLFSSTSFKCLRDVKSVVEGVALSNASIIFVLVMHIWSPETTPHSYYTLKIYKVATSYVTLKAITGQKDLLVGVTAAAGCAIDVYINTCIFT